MRRFIALFCDLHRIKRNPSEWLVMNRSYLAGFDRPMTNWVHLTADQLSNRIDRTGRGVTAGREGLLEINSLIGFSERCFAAIIVLLLHSVPSWVAGDLLVREDGKTHPSQFEGSRYLAAIDENFDYKHERRASLVEIKARRSSVVRF